MSQLVELWTYPGADVPMGYCAYKEDCPTKWVFIEAIEREYGDVVNLFDIDSDFAVKFGDKHRFVGHKTRRSKEMWITR